MIGFEGVKIKVVGRGMRNDHMTGMKREIEIREEMITIAETEMIIGKSSSKEKAKVVSSTESLQGLKKLHPLRMKKLMRILLKNLHKNRKEPQCLQELVEFTFHLSNLRKCLRRFKQKKINLKSIRNICGRCYGNQLMGLSTK